MPILDHCPFCDKTDSYAYTAHPDICAKCQVKELKGAENEENTTDQKIEQDQVSSQACEVCQGKKT